MKIYYSPDFTAADHEFDTTKKAGRIARELWRRPIAGVQLVAPRPAGLGELGLVHTTDYIDCVLYGGGHPIDPRRHRTNLLPWSKGLVTAVRTSTGGVVDALAAALQESVAGSLSSGLHHAHADRGGGFCTFNGLAVAARLAVAQGLLRRVLILDLDAHFGDGTMAILRDDPGVDIIDVSTGAETWVTREGDRHVVAEVGPGGRYLQVVHRLLEEADTNDVDAVLYNAGMDPHEGCDIGGLEGVSSAVLRRRERMVFRWCHERDLPVAFVLAGGYEGPELPRAELDALHRATVEEAAGVWGRGLSAGAAQ